MMVYLYVNSERDNHFQKKTKGLKTLVVMIRYFILQ